MSAAKGRLTLSMRWLLAVLIAGLVLLLPAAALAGPITVTSADFGTVASDPTGYLPSSKLVVVTNTGIRPLTVVGVSWVFHGPGTFSNNPSCGSAAVEVLQPGENCTDLLLWDPGAAGQITQSKWCIATVGHRPVCVRITGRAVRP